MHARRLLTLSCDDEPIWVRLYIRPIGDRWAAMIVGDDVPPPGQDELKGCTIFAATAEEAERLAKAYLGMAEPMN